MSSTRPRIDTGVFIGGPADGRRKRIPHGTRVLIPAEAPTTEPTNSKAAFMPAEYRRETIAGEGHDFYVWVASELTPDDALAMLLRGYRR